MLISPQCSSGNAVLIIFSQKRRIRSFYREIALSCDIIVWWRGRHWASETILSSRNIKLSSGLGNLGKPLLYNAYAFAKLFDDSFVVRSFLCISPLCAQTTYMQRTFVQCSSKLFVLVWKLYVPRINTTRYRVPYDLYSYTVNIEFSENKCEYCVLIFL